MKPSPRKDGGPVQAAVLIDDDDLCWWSRGGREAWAVYLAPNGAAVTACAWARGGVGENSWWLREEEVLEAAREAAK